MTQPTPLDAETILSATEEVLRRHGPAKATVLDVAQVLGVSHASVYRRFSSKAALREAVTRRWLRRITDALAPVAGDTRTPPAERLRLWLSRFFAEMRARTGDDPQLFATYRILTAEHNEAVADHLADLLGQLRGIIEDGITDGEFTAADPATTAEAVFDATARFHHPLLAAEWARPGTRDAAEAVSALVVRGLRDR
ncbi:TetR family transcriptional regulator [Streptomyces sp. NPDC047046]|uniref:TetR family transcriptional regulator n=1 Tax=Streptomyces sp. NPDC047046 TaxID=3155378 RepID=UPI0033F4302E